MKVPESEIRYSPLSLVDIGRVFFWQGRLFRGINGDSVPAVQKMFECGLVARLVSEHLLVNSWLTDLHLEGYGLVVEHEVVPVTTYPREWSFSMLRDAALLVLRLNEIAISYGYQTKDCNGYNVLFGSGGPVFVDLGSFVEVRTRADLLLSYKEFLRSYYYPLQMWRSGGQYLGGRVAPRALALLCAPEAYLRYRWPFFRWFNGTTISRAWKTLCSIRTLQHNSLDNTTVRLSPWEIRILVQLRKTRLFSRPARISVLSHKLRKLPSASSGSTWADYHDEFSRDAVPITTNRFDYVATKLSELDVETVLELAGNQGVLSRALKRKSGHVRVTCTDMDAIAIDKGYRATRDAREDICWALLNPFAFEGSAIERPPEQRFRADAVVVLALTHHLTLTQNFRLDYVFDVIAGYAKRYVLVEFMPLGLFDGTSAPSVPDWYNEAWFLKGFTCKFVLVERIQLEPNRILFVGSTTTASP
jgi:hypothetical protein